MCYVIKMIVIMQLTMLHHAAAHFPSCGEHVRNTGTCEKPAEIIGPKSASQTETLRWMLIRWCKPFHRNLIPSQFETETSNRHSDGRKRGHFARFRQIKTETSNRHSDKRCFIHVGFSSHCRDTQRIRYDHDR
jgi:hypothetical protein